MEKISIKKKDPSRQKSHNLAELLISELKQNKPIPHSRFYTDSELCKKSGYNLLTVRKAVSRLSALGYIYRIQGKGTLISPRCSKLSIIIVFTNNSSFEQDYQFLGFQANLARYANELSTVLNTVLLTAEHFIAQADDLRYYYPDLGVVIFYKNIDPLIKTFARLADNCIPHLFVGSDSRLSNIEKTKINYYVYSEKSIADAALSHLAGQGRRSIAFIGNNLPIGKARLEAAREACKHFSINLFPENIFIFDTIEDLYPSLIRFFSRPLNFDAILSSGDVFAFQAIQALTRLGISVPEKVAVIGIDNTVLNIHIIPPLSSIEIQPVSELRTCLKDIIKLLDNPLTRIQKKFKIQVVKREST